MVEDEDSGGRSRDIDNDRGSDLGRDVDDPPSAHTETGKGKGKGLKTSTMTNEVKGGLLVLGKKARTLSPTPIPIPGPAPGSGSQTQSVAVPATLKQAVHTGTDTGFGMTPIPLPSFATAGRALKVGGGVVSPSQSQPQSQYQSTPFVDGELGNAKSMSPSKSPSKSKGSHLSRAKSLGVGSTIAVNSLGALNTNSNDISGSGSASLSTSIYGNINDNVFLPSGVARNWGHDEDGHEGEDEGEESKINTKAKLGRNGDRGVGNDGERGFERERGDEGGDAGGDADGDADVEEEGEQRTKKRQGRHLSHNALALILERGRPITRMRFLTPHFQLIYLFIFLNTGRVLVTSSPLYQPMDTMERLGYEVRVYMRVPDLGLSLFHPVCHL